MKCDACCNCRACTYAYLAQYVDGCIYELMMDMAVFNYTEMPVGVFEFLCGMDLEELVDLCRPIVRTTET